MTPHAPLLIPRSLTTRTLAPMLTLPLTSTINPHPIPSSYALILYPQSSREPEPSRSTPQSSCFGCGSCPHPTPSPPRCASSPQVRLDKAILVGCMTNVVHAFHLKGRKMYTIYLPAPIACMQLLSLTKTRNVRALLVALQVRTTPAAPPARPAR